MQERLEVTQLDERTCRLLYEDHGLRDKEIGDLFGLSESGVAYRRRRYGIQTNRVPRTAVVIIYQGPPVKKTELTESVLRSLCSVGGLTDSKIGKMFGLTGEGVAYRRKKYGITVASKRSPIKDAKKRLRETSKEILNQDYSSMTVQEFSSKYGLSRTVWLPYLRSVGIRDKKSTREESYPPLTKQQQSVVVGGLLGDGAISSQHCYYESHSNKQEQYLRRKYRILKPYSSRISPCDEDTGLRMSTVSHPVFKAYRDVFYDAAHTGKLIPVDFIMKHWDDEILATWFFDDGCIDDVSGDVIINNKCPFREQLDSLVACINEVYGWDIHSGTQGSIYRVYFPRSCRKEFGDLLLKYATPDLYYKIPEESLPQKISLLDTSAKDFSPKLYRASDDVQKKRIEHDVFQHYRNKGFPYPTLTLERATYMVSSFLKRFPKMKGGVIEHNTSGLALCESFFPNIYKCRRSNYESPVDLWESDDFLRGLVRNRLRYSDRLNDSSMRRGIKLSKYCVSNFKPMIALYLYKKYALSGISDGSGRVLDYSAGFGSRLLAALSLGLTYVGCEPCVETRENLKRFGGFLSEQVGGDFTIVETGSEEYREGGKFDFIFSSPPYFDFEVYSKDPGQSILRYPSYEQWLEGYWRKTIQNARGMLNSSGHFGVCLSPYYRRDILGATLRIAREEGLYFVEDYKCPFKQVFAAPGRYEVVLIFSLEKAQPLREPRFLEVPAPEMKSAFCSVDRKRHRKVYTNEQFEGAEECVRTSRITSRSTYKSDGVNGVPVHVISHHYGSWNKFICACGIEPGYEAKSPRECVEEYFEACDKEGRSLSFYDYGKCTAGKHRDRLKRLFNAGRKHHALRDDLFKAAAAPALRAAFLDLLQ